jgi:glycosyltransferase involved in cell wall biosynthesis
LEATFWREEVGWPEKQLRVIPNGVDLQEFDQISDRELEEVKNLWPPGKIRLLFVGRLTKAKGIDTLLRSLPYNTTASLLAVGPDAGELPTLKALTAELKLESRVNFSGALSRGQVCGVFRACDIFIIPSRFGENFGIVAIEAMAAGKPVIASDCGGLPTLIKNEKNGLSFPVECVGALNNAIIRLTSSEELRQTLGAAGRKMVEAEYTWEHVAQEYLRLFSALS